MPDRLVAMRAVLLHQARLVLAHSSGDFFDRLIQSGIHVLALGVRFDGDVVGAEKNDFGNVPVFLDVENDLGLDDSRVVEVKSLDFLDRMVTEGIGHLFVPYGDGDRQIDVGSLHVRIGWLLGEWTAISIALSVNELVPVFVALPCSTLKKFRRSCRNGSRRASRGVQELQVVGTCSTWGG